MRLPIQVAQRAPARGPGCGDRAVRRVVDHGPHRGRAGFGAHAVAEPGPRRNPVGPAAAGAQAGRRAGRHPGRLPGLRPRPATAAGDAVRATHRRHHPPLPRRRRTPPPVRHHRARHRRCRRPRPGGRAAAHPLAGTPASSPFGPKPPTWARSADGGWSWTTRSARRCSPRGSSDRNRTRQAPAGWRRRRCTQAQITTDPQVTVTVLYSQPARSPGR
jgi:hypothetical protein